MFEYMYLFFFKDYPSKRLVHYTYEGKLCRQDKSLVGSGWQHERGGQVGDRGGQVGDTPFQNYQDNIQNTLRVSNPHGKCYCKKKLIKKS